MTVQVFDPAESANVRKTAVAPLQEAWVKRADTEAKVKGQVMLDEFLGYVREFEKNSTYVPGFQRFIDKCGKKG